MDQKICVHFGECGGCQFQDVPYQKQLENKHAWIQELFAFSQPATEIKPVRFYPEWFYRNKMEFTFSCEDDKIICGLHSRKKQRAVIDIKECLIFSPDTGVLLDAVRAFAMEKKYSVYNNASHKGFLRHCIIRETKFTKEIMIGIVTSGEEQLDREAFVQMLLALPLHARIQSIHWIVNNSLSDAVVFEKNELIYGRPYIQEQLGQFTFNIGIDSFFQVNSQGIVDLYSKIKMYAQAQEKERVLDLFCGVGSIGIFLSPEVKYVWGVEISEAIVNAAWENARLNKIENICFFAQDVRRFLNTQGTFYKDIEIAVINPPRSGLSQKIHRALLRVGPQRIFYSSCNPETLCQDLKAIFPYYHLEFIEPFDFFPHTRHVETLAVLRKNPDKTFV